MTYHLKIAEKSTLAISKFFDETSIGHIVELLEDKLNLSDDDICEKLLNLFNDKGNVLTKKIVFNYKDKTISNFVNLDLDKIFKSSITPLIYNFIKSKKDNIEKIVSNLVEEKTNKVLSNKIENLISKEKV